MSENYSGDLLKSLRKEQKMSQTKLAELSGISQSALVKYEKGTRKISKEIDNALSKVLNIDTLLKNDEVDCLIDQLIHYRDINDLSNKNLAFEMEISEVSLSYFLNRKRKPSKELQRRITIFLLDKEKEMLLEIKQKDGSFNFPIVDKDALGERIQVIRKLRGETLEKFGKNFTRPVGKNVLNRWEKGVSQTKGY